MGATGEEDRIDDVVVVVVKVNVADVDMGAVVEDVVGGVGVGDSSSWMDISVSCGCI